MRKNVAGQRIGAQLVSATDGSAFTGSVTVSVCGDAGTQATGSVGSGACTHEGNGYHTYAAAQAETNFDLIAFTFTGSGAVPVTIQVYTRPATGLLAPTVADRTLDVSATGEAGIDWANVGSPTTTLNLSATTISTSQAVASVSGAVGSVTGNVGGNVTGSVGSVLAIAANAVNASALAADAVAEIQSGLATAANLGTEIAAILEDTGTTIPAQIAALNNLSSAQVVSALGTGTWATAIPWNAAWDAEVQSECTDALNAYDPPTNTEMEARTLVAASYATASLVDTVETEIAKIIKSGESRTVARTGETSITFTETRA